MLPCDIRELSFVYYDTADTCTVCFIHQRRTLEFKCISEKEIWKRFKLPILEPYSFVSNRRWIAFTQLHSDTTVCSVFQVKGSVSQNIEMPVKSNLKQSVCVSTTFKVLNFHNNLHASFFSEMAQTSSVLFVIQCSCSC